VVAKPREMGVEAEEEVGGRDVVVDDDEAVGAWWMSRPEALPIEKWKTQTVSGAETSRYSHRGRARWAIRGCTISAKMSDSWPAARSCRWMASASFPIASP